MNDIEQLRALQFLRNQLWKLKVEVAIRAQIMVWDEYKQVGRWQWPWSGGIAHTVVAEIKWWIPFGIVMVTLLQVLKIQLLQSQI